MHGKPREVMWTRLSLPAPAGSTTITVATSTGWLPGDQIVIAPSGWGVTEGEIRTIISASGQGEGIHSQFITWHTPTNMTVHLYSLLNHSFN